MFALYYKPPCGTWYVHSHKLYPSRDAARANARRFLPAETEIAIVAVNENWLNYLTEKVA